MYAEDTARLVAYLNARRSSVDRQVLARLRADAARGKAASAIVRLALAEHYGIEHRPTPPDPVIEQVSAQSDQLTQMTEALAGLTAQVAALQGQVGQLVTLVAQQAAQVSALQAENQQLRQLLLAATFGDKAQRQQAERAALALVQGGNGHG